MQTKMQLGLHRKLGGPPVLSTGGQRGEKEVQGTSASVL